MFCKNYVIKKLLSVTRRITITNSLLFQMPNWKCNYQSSFIESVINVELFGIGSFKMFQSQLKWVLKLEFFSSIKLILDDHYFFFFRDSTNILLKPSQSFLQCSRFCALLISILRRIGFFSLIKFQYYKIRVTTIIIPDLVNVWL